MISIPGIMIALLAGILPAIFWLWFWLKEDNLHPEPKNYLLKAFALGGLMVVAALIIEGVTEPLRATSELGIVIFWSLTEELLKFLAVFIVLKNGAPIDEPVDWMIYMLTAALGFASLENALFLLEPVGQNLLLEGIIVGNLRFVGATLLHVLTSTAHGAALALSFYLNNHVKKRYFALGLTLATVMHALFNYYLLTRAEFSNLSLFFAFAAVWIGMITIILIFEKVKQMKPRGERAKEGLL